MVHTPLVGLCEVYVAPARFRRCALVSRGRLHHSGVSLYFITLRDAYLYLDGQSVRDDAATLH